MRLHRRTLAILPSIFFGLTALLMAYSSGPLPKMTGGFGEKTCVMCHNSYRLNDGRALGGAFEIQGVPQKYVMGQTYPITVVIAHPGQKRWGFELSARFSSSGKQGGQLSPLDKMAQVIDDDGIQYIRHTLASTSAGTANGPAEFHFNWIAPDPSGGRIVFNAAGNAANSSNSPTGDYIYTAGAWSGELIAGGKNTAAQSNWGERLMESSKIVNLPAPVNLHKGAFEIHIQHRFLGALVDSHPRDAFGIDSGANINLGLNYAVTDRLSMGVSRARFDQVIAWTGTYGIQTRSDSFWKMSLLAGVEGQHNFTSQFSPYLQLSSRFDYRGLSFYVVPTAVFHSRDQALVNAFRSEIINPDSEHTLSMGFAADIAINRRFSIVGEVVPRLAGYGGFQHHPPTAAGGVEIRTSGHVFNILVSSSWDFTPAKHAVNSEGRDVSLGFNIYRRIR